VKTGRAATRTLAAALLAAAFLLPAGPAGAAPGLPRPWTPWPGGPTPELGLKDLGGADHALEAYRGKVVILNFWATWCEPCRDEMPSLNRLRKSLEGRPVAMLAVNVAEGEARINDFMARIPVDFPVLLDRDSQAARAWKVRVLPTTVIIGTDGRVRYTYVGGRDWNDESVRTTIGSLMRERAGR